MKFKISFYFSHHSFTGRGEYIFTTEPIEINYNEENMKEVINNIIKKNNLGHNKNNFHSSVVQNYSRLHVNLNIDFYEEHKKKIDNFINDTICELIKDLGMLLDNDLPVYYINLELDKSNIIFYNTYKYSINKETKEQELKLIEGFGEDLLTGKTIKYVDFLKEE